MRAVSLALIVALATLSAAPSSEAHGPYGPNVRAAREWLKHRTTDRAFRCADILWDRESHWNPRSLNRYSGAYGIPQAVPAVKMASAGPDWRTNATTQVKWGRWYVRGRYGSFCGALRFQTANGWY